jgi:hypothetical protein
VVEKVCGEKSSSEFFLSKIKLTLTLPGTKLSQLKLRLSAL